VFVSSLAAAACSGPASVKPAGETRQVTDDLGRTVTVPKRIERVVSLAPNLTENIFAVGAGDRLVGVTTLCDYPGAAKNIAKVGDTVNPNMETIVALDPQVVFVSTSSQIESFSGMLDSKGIAVFITNPSTLDGVFGDLQQLGDLFGTGEAADKLVSELEGRIDAVAGKIGDSEKPRVFVQISKEPLFTAGRDSFLTDIIDRAGGRSVTADIATAYPNLNKETALALDPEVIILSDSDDNREPNDVFKNSTAVKKGKVFRVNPDLIARPGPRLVDGLEQLARDLHPDKFR
jgi:iron complex transport system substrate-binding protein